MVTIPEVRSWNLSDLSSTATGLRNGAGTLDEHALTVINKLKGIGTDWQGETRDAAAVRTKDQTDSMQEKARRFRGAANVLDTAVDQMGRLRTAILDRADDPDNKQKFVISDDGTVVFSQEYAATLTEETQQAAEIRRTNLETELRSLLATADLAGQQYDWKVTSALMGVPDDQRPFSPSVPPNGGFPRGPKQAANRDGTGPDQYNVDKPDWNEKLRLQGTRLWAEGAAEGAHKLGWTEAPRLMAHFLGGSGTQAKVSVDRMMNDMSWFKDSVAAQTRNTAAIATKAMPAGYTGPVAFQSGWTSTAADGGPARPGAKSNPDWLAAMGTFSYQSSGVATPSANGTYSVAAQSSVYDYYNWDSTDKKWYPQASDLNTLHRAGWAQNFETAGTSTTQTSTYP